MPRVQEHPSFEHPLYWAAGQESTSSFHGYVPLFTHDMVRHLILITSVAAKHVMKMLTFLVVRE